MTRNLKCLLVVAFAVMATEAAAGSIAQAAFKSAIKPTTVTISQDGAGKTGHQVFSAGGMLWTCEKVSDVGTMANMSENTIVAKQLAYANCNNNGVSATVSTNECTYTFHAESVSGKMDINCPAGKSLEFISSACTMKIGPQEGLLGITFHNVGAKEEVTMEELIKNVSWETSGAGCVEIGKGENGQVFTGNQLFTGEEDNVPKPKMANLWVE